MSDEEILDKFEEVHDPQALADWLAGTDLPALGESCPELERELDAIRSQAKHMVRVEVDLSEGFSGWAERLGLVFPDPEMVQLMPKPSNSFTQNPDSFAAASNWGFEDLCRVVLLHMKGPAQLLTTPGIGDELAHFYPGPIVDDRVVTVLCPKDAMLDEIQRKAQIYKSVSSLAAARKKRTLHGKLHAPQQMAADAFTCEGISYAETLGRLLPSGMTVDPNLFTYGERERKFSCMPSPDEMDELKLEIDRRLRPLHLRLVERFKELPLEKGKLLEESDEYRREYSGPFDAAYLELLEERGFKGTRTVKVLPPKMGVMLAHFYERADNRTDDEKRGILTVDDGNYSDIDGDDEPIDRFLPAPESFPLFTNDFFKHFRVQDALFLSLEGTQKPFAALATVLDALIPEEDKAHVRKLGPDMPMESLSHLKHKFKINSNQLRALELHLTGRQAKKCDLLSLFRHLLKHLGCIRKGGVSSNRICSGLFLFIGQCDPESAALLKEVESQNDLHIFKCQQATSEKDEDVIRSAAISALFKGRSQIIEAGTHFTGEYGDISYPHGGQGALPDRVLVDVSMSPSETAERFRNILCGYEKLAETVVNDAFDVPDIRSVFRDKDPLAQRYSSQNSEQRKFLEGDFYVKMLNRTGPYSAENVIGQRISADIPKPGSDGFADLMDLSKKMSPERACEFLGGHVFEDTFLDRMASGLDDHVVIGGRYDGVVRDAIGALALERAFSGNSLRPVLQLFLNAAVTFELDLNEQSKDLSSQKKRVTEYSVDQFNEIGLDQIYGFTQAELAFIADLMTQNGPYSEDHIEFVVRLLLDYELYSESVPLPKKLTLIYDVFDRSCSLTNQVIKRVLGSKMDTSVVLALSAYPSEEQLAAQRLEISFSNWQEAALAEWEAPRYEEQHVRDERQKIQKERRASLRTHLLHFIQVATPEFASSTLQKMYDDFDQGYQDYCRSQGASQSVESRIRTYERKLPKDKIHNSCIEQFLGVMTRAWVEQGRRAIFLKEKEHARTSYKHIHRFKGIVNRWYGRDPSERDFDDDSFGKGFPYTLAELSDQMFIFMAEFNFLEGSLKGEKKYETCPTINLEDFLRDHMMAAGIPYSLRSGYHLSRYIQALAEQPKAGVETMAAYRLLMDPTGWERFKSRWQEQSVKTVPVRAGSPEIKVVADPIQETRLGPRREQFCPANFSIESLLPYTLLLALDATIKNPNFKDQFEAVKSDAGRVLPGSVLGRQLAMHYFRFKLGTRHLQYMEESDPRSARREFAASRDALRSLEGNEKLMRRVENAINDCDIPTFMSLSRVIIDQLPERDYAEHQVPEIDADVRTMITNANRILNALLERIERLYQGIDKPKAEGHFRLEILVSYVDLLLTQRYFKQLLRKRGVNLALMDPDHEEIGDKVLPMHTAARKISVITDEVKRIIEGDGKDEDNFKWWAKQLKATIEARAAQIPSDPVAQEIHNEMSRLAQAKKHDDDDFGYLLD